MARHTGSGGTSLVGEGAALDHSPEVHAICPDVAALKLALKEGYIFLATSWAHDRSSMNPICYHKYYSIWLIEKKHVLFVHFLEAWLFKHPPNITCTEWAQGCGTDTDRHQRPSGRQDPAKMKDQRWTAPALRGWGSPTSLEMLFRGGYWSH